MSEEKQIEGVDMTTMPMVTLGVRVPIPHYHKLVAMARERGWTTKAGRPNVSAAARAVLAQALDDIEARLAELEPEEETE